MDSDSQSNDQSVSQNEDKVHVTSPNEEDKTNEAQKSKNDDLDVNDVNSNKKVNFGFQKPSFYTIKFPN